MNFQSRIRALANQIIGGGSLPGQSRESPARNPLHQGKIVSGAGRQRLLDEHNLLRCLWGQLLGDLKSKLLMGLALRSRDRQLGVGGAVIFARKPTQSGGALLAQA